MRRYSVVRILPDGVPFALSYWETLEDALSERDLQRRDHSPFRAYFAVIDNQDEERGQLDYEDTYEEVA